MDQEREPIYQNINEIDCEDPLAVLDIGIVAENLVFPQPGDYLVRLLVDDEFLIERRLVVALPPHMQQPLPPSNPGEN